MKLLVDLFILPPFNLIILAAIGLILATNSGTAPSS